MVNVCLLQEEPVNKGELINPASLSSAVARPRAVAGGLDLYSTLDEKCAALFHSLIANHPFTNGNKRTAVLATEMFYCVNGHLLVFVDAEETFVKLSVETASYRERGISHEDIYAKILSTLKSRVVPINEHLKKLNEPLYNASFGIQENLRQHFPSE